MGKHDIGTPINESLEKHYQDEKKRLTNEVRALKEIVNERDLEIERLKFAIRLKEVEIESLVKSLAEA